MSKKITGQIVRVSRRRFLNGTAGAIATTAAVLLPQQTIVADEPMSLEEVARALHEATGRWADQNTPFDFNRRPVSLRSTAFDFVMEQLRYSSADEIQCLLKPLFGGAS